MPGSGPAAQAAAQALDGLKEAAAALRQACADAPAPPPAAVTQAPATGLDWEGRLAEVNAAVCWAQSPRQVQLQGAGHDGSSSASGSLALHQSELIDAVAGCPTNCVTFLPLGLGLRPVLDAVLSRAAAQQPDKHVLVVVDRPAHALSHAQRLKAELGLPTAVFCGGDFLYSFQQQFQSNRVLVFTAGLLLRLLKTGVYRLGQASLLVMLDAFTAVRNHPSNTLVREYWKVTEEGQRPRVVGVLASQLPNKPRPFDRLRQNLRKLCHSLQAQLLLPAGAGLVQLEAQLHHDSIQLHSYALAPPEERLASVLQQHLLGLWDVLHEFGLNHFGRLVQFMAAGGGQAAAAAGAGGTPGTPAGAVGGTPVAGASGTLGAGGTPPAGSTPTPPRLSPLAGSPVPEGSPATPVAPPAPTQISAAAAAAEQPDPMQHDWAQVELQVVHSIWHSNALPARGEHVREPDALALMMHVLDCVRALRLLLEVGPRACLERLPAALDSLAAFLQESIAGPPPFGGVIKPLKARILQVAAASPLLQWAQQQPPQQALQDEQQAEADSEQQQGQQRGGEVDTSPGDLSPRASEVSDQYAELSLRLTSLLQLSPSKPGKSRPPVDDGPRAAATAGCSRAAALVQALSEQLVDTQLSGRREKRRVAVVASNAEAVAAVEALLVAAPELAGMPVLLMRDAPEEEEEQAELPAQQQPEVEPEAAEQQLAAALAAAAAQAAAAAENPASPAAAEAAAAQEDKAAAVEKAGIKPAAQEASGEPVPDSAFMQLLTQGGLTVHLLQVSELPELERRISCYHSLVWYSSGDVLHASSQELESAALSACHRLSAAAMDAARGKHGQSPSRSVRDESPDGSPCSGWGRLACHVLATASQVLALGEVRRVDHSLKAAMQLVLLGDAAAEEKLTMLAHRNTAAVLEPEAKSVLEMLCCGLCGTPPAYATLMASPSKQSGRGRQPSPRAGAADAAASGSAAGEHGEADETASTAAASAPEPAPVLFQTSVTLPAAYFPPERFHVAGVSMPLDVFVGPALPSEQAACAAASMQALMELHRLGIIVRYWPSRLLLAQHLLPRTGQSDASPSASADPSAPGSLPIQPLFLGTAAAATPASAIAAAEWTPGGGLPAAVGPPPGGQGGHTANFFCPLCNVAATGQKAFDAHLRGFRHQRRIKQAQLLQQGQEVSAMLRGLLLEEQLPSEPGPTGQLAAPAGGAPLGAEEAALPGASLPSLAVRRPDLSHLYDDEGSDTSGSPSFTDRQVYSPEPTPFHCPTCNVYCTSERLLEAHRRGRKHQRRVAGIESPAGRPSSPKVQPLVTPYYCPMCGLYATSEEQLRMHMLGKRHTRMTQLHRQRGTLPAGMPGAWGGSGLSLQQQHHQQLMAAAAAAAAAFGGGAGAAWVPGSGVRTASEQEAGLRLSQVNTGSATAGSAGSGSSTPLAGAGAPGGAGGGAWGAGSLTEEHALLLDASGNQRIYRCDLCGVVTPSRRHYDYHLQGVKHTRRLLRAQGQDPNSASQPGTPASCGSPLAGSRSASPATRSTRGRHSRHSSLDGNAGGGAAGAAAGSTSGNRGGEVAPESLICSVCGIMATSAVNLEDHYRGRRHQKNVERLKAQEAAAAAAASAVAAASLPAGGPPPAGPFANVPAPPAGAAAPSGGSGGGLQRSSSGITLGADGLRLSGGLLLSAGSLPRLPSGDVFDGFPCVRIGDVLLPSSMDLRAFLEEMQHLEDGDDDTDVLPTIAELHEPGDGPSTGGTPQAATPQSATPVAAAPLPAQGTWAYGGSSNTSPGSGSASPGGMPGLGSAAGTGFGAGAWTGSSMGGMSSGQQPVPPTGASRQPGGSPGFDGSGLLSSRPPSGGYSRGGSRPGSGQRLSRFAMDQQAQQAQQAAQMAQQAAAQQVAQQAAQQQAAQAALQQAAAMSYAQQYGMPGYAYPPMAQPGYNAAAPGYGGDYASYAAATALAAAQQAAVMQQVATYGGMPALGYGVAMPLSGPVAMPPVSGSPNFYRHPGSSGGRQPPMPPPSPSARYSHGGEG